MFLNACMVMRLDEEGYVPAKSVSKGTAYLAEMMPEGAGAVFSASAMVIGGGSAKVFGPYRFRMTAFGRKGEHLMLRVYALRFRSATGRKIYLGMDQLAGAPLFVQGEYRDEVQSVYEVRGVIKWKPEEQGTLYGEADVEVTTIHGIEKSTVKFVFDPLDKVRVDAVNVPWEIKRSIWKDRREHPITAWATSPAP
ncbi:MAG: hypothetical protein ACK5LK_11035 [Chthoniobacterales bacterium]